ncbi:SIS domain-containing protein [Kineococcus sp. SYSU DK003]|uniref:SIS domain-containing protein n=1 Tax=Kineococcus sp. SYSU DK003 TaxID=3383124 RepID=UPI003D7CDFC9
MPSTFVDAEIASQPDVWRRAAALAPTVADALPRPGERVAVVGCGTSWFVAMSYAVLREQAGQGLTDAFAGSEFPAGRSYDRVLAISRSGTTTEVVQLLAAVAGPTTLVTAVADSPAAEQADAVVAMDFADERSVVQTRFATSALTLLRAALAATDPDLLDLDALVADGAAALEVELDDLLDAQQCTFLGRGWTVGLAHEAGLKTREAARFWAEAYPAMDYRHGPVAIAEPGRLVWAFGEVPTGLADEVAATGARFVTHDLDPQAALVVAQRFAVAVASARGLDADNPRSLTRSVILT